MATIKEDNKGWKNLLKNLRDLESNHVEVGSMSGKTHPNFEGTVSSLAALYEFGFERDGHHIRASFIDPVDFSNLDLLAKTLDEHLPELILTNGRANSVYTSVGEKMTKAYKNYIEKDNVDLTVDGIIKEKESGIRLIDTGSVKDSMDFSVEEGGA